MLHMIIRKGKCNFACNKNKKEKEGSRSKSCSYFDSRRQIIKQTGLSKDSSFLSSLLITIIYSSTEYLYITISCIRYKMKKLIDNGHPYITKINL